MARAQKSPSDFYEILALFRKRVWLIGFFILGVLFVIILYNELIPPLYQTELSVIYEELIQPIPNTQFFQTRQRRETILSNQVEEITSRRFFQQVADSIAGDYLPAFHIPETISSEKMARKYIGSLIRKNTQVLVPENNSNVIKIKYINENPELTYHVAQKIAAVITYHTIEQRKQSISNARQLIENQLQVYKTKLDTAEKRLMDFKESQKISFLNQETNQLLKQITEAEVLLNTAKSQQKATEQRLKFIRGKIQSEQNGLVATATDALIPRLEKLSDKLVDLELQRTDLLMKGYSKQHPRLVKLDREISQARQNLASETKQLIRQGKFVDPVSQLGDLLQESVTLEANLKAYEAQVRALTKILNDYDTKIQRLPEMELQLARLVRDVKTNEKIYTMLLEERERTRIVEAQNRGNLRLIDAPEMPTSPFRPRKKLNLMIGFLIGLIIGSLMVFVLESLDTSIKTAEDVKKYTALSVLGTIPRIKSNVNGHFSIFNRNQKPTSAEISQLITIYEANSQASEAFRMLRTNIQFSSSDFRSNTVLVTSPQPGDGKSTTAINLAITTAQLGYRTLLIDADLRRPVLHKIFQVDREPGLVDVLQSTTFQNLLNEHLSVPAREYWNDIIEAKDASKLDSMDQEPFKYLVNDQKFHFESLSSLYAEIELALHNFSGLEHLSILTTGTAVENSSEILGSKIMRTFISLVKKKYDVVLIDSPPVLVVTDTSILGSLVDGVLVVCFAGKTHQRTVNRAIELLEKGNTKIWGIVLNQALEAGTPRSYKKYYKATA